MKVNDLSSEILVHGTPEAPITREAKASLERLASRLRAEKR